MTMIFFYLCLFYCLLLSFLLSFFIVVYDQDFHVIPSDVKTEDFV